MVVIKAKLGDELRRFTLPEKANYTHLRSLLQQLFSVQLSRYDIKYVDDEGDTVVIASDDELEEAVRLAVSSKPAILRLTLSLSAKTAAPAQTSYRQTESVCSDEQAFDDALKFVKRVRLALGDDPHKFITFLGLMDGLNKKTISLEKLRRDMMRLLVEHPALLIGFNLFLPAAYHVKVQDLKSTVKKPSPATPENPLQFSLPNLHAATLPSLALQPSSVSTNETAAASTVKSEERIKIPARTLGRLAALCQECTQLSTNLNAELEALSSSSLQMTKQAAEDMNQITQNAMQEQLLKSQLPSITQSMLADDDPLQDLHVTTAQLTLSVQQNLHKNLQAHMTSINERAEQVQESQRKLESECKDLYERMLQAGQDFANSISLQTQQLHEKTVGDIANF